MNKNEYIIPTTSFHMVWLFQHIFRAHAHTYISRHLYIFIYFIFFSICLRWKNLACWKKKVVALLAGLMEHWTRTIIHRLVQCQRNMRIKFCLKFYSQLSSVTWGGDSTVFPDSMARLGDSAWSRLTSANSEPQHQKPSKKADI